MLCVFLRFFLFLDFDFFVGLGLSNFTLGLYLFFLKILNLSLSFFIIFSFSFIILSTDWGFLIFLVFFDLFLILSWEIYLTEYFIIVFKDISNNLAICYVKISFFQSKCSDKSLLTVLVLTLILPHLSEGLLDMRQPIRNFPLPHGSTQNIDASSGGYFQSDSG